MFYLGHKSEEGEQERDLDLEGFDADPGPTFYINAEPVLNFTWLVKHYYLINITQLFFTFYS